MAAALASQALVEVDLSLVSTPMMIQSLHLHLECPWRSRGQGSRQREVK